MIISWHWTALLALSIPVAALVSQPKELPAWEGTGNSVLLAASHSSGRVKPGRILVSVEGQAAGTQARLTVRGLKGTAKGARKTTVVSGQTVVTQLRPGRYRVTATSTSPTQYSATVAPSVVKLTRSRGAVVVVRFRLQTPDAITTPAPSMPGPTAGPAPSGSPGPSSTTTPTASPSPTTSSTSPPPSGTRFTTLAAGALHTCGIDTQSKAWCWGSDSLGQLGDGAAHGDYSPTPVLVAGGRSFTALAAGQWHTCALDTVGTAWCWGSDEIGQVGDGQYPIRSSMPSPAAVGGGHTFTSLTAGAHHTCGLDASKKTWCWGDEEWGQIGNDPETGPHWTPISGAFGLTLNSIAAGWYHSCGIKPDTKAWCWGHDGYGQIGDGARGISELLPKAVAGNHAFKSLRGGEWHTCAIDTTDQTWCWGNDEDGQLGDGDSQGRVFSSSPAAVAGVHHFAGVFLGGHHTCAVDTDQRAWCWGSSLHGQIGDGTTGLDSPTISPSPVTGDLQFTSMATGEWHTCAIDLDGRAWCWGSDEAGQLGTEEDGTRDEALPVPVDAGD